MRLLGDVQVKDALPLTFELVVEHAASKTAQHTAASRNSFDIPAPACAVGIFGVKPKMQAISGDEIYVVSCN
jgi:hypothetical protein